VDKGNDTVTRVAVALDTAARRLLTAKDRNLKLAESSMLGKKNQVYEQVFDNRAGLLNNNVLHGTDAPATDDYIGVVMKYGRCSSINSMLP
jgi:hypothetical protein